MPSDPNIVATYVAEIVPTSLRIPLNAFQFMPALWARTAAIQFPFLPVVIVGKEDKTANRQYVYKPLHCLSSSFGECAIGAGMSTPHSGHVSDFG